MSHLNPEFRSSSPEFRSSTLRIHANPRVRSFVSRVQPPRFPSPNSRVHTSRVQTPRARLARFADGCLSSSCGHRRTVRSCARHGTTFSVIFASMCVQSSMMHCQKEVNPLSHRPQHLFRMSKRMTTLVHVWCLQLFLSRAWMAPKSTPESTTTSAHFSRPRPSTTVRARLAVRALPSSSLPPACLPAYSA